MAPIPLGMPPAPPVETAPSVMLNEGPTFSRLVGFIGLVFLVLGAAAVISTRVLGPRLVSEGMGFIFALVGLAMMLQHAVTDGEIEIRRMYGGFALFWILISVIAAFVPGAADGGQRMIGYYLLPWGVVAGILGLLFAIPFCRHETDEMYRNAAVTVLLAVGGLLSVGAVAAGIFKPAFLTGPGLTLALLGLAFICAYLGQVDTSDGVGFTVAFSLGAFGALVLFYAIGRAAFPTLLFEGPGTLRLPNGSLDKWKVAFRLAGGLAFVLPAILAFTNRSALWLKGVTGAIALIGGGVVLVSLFTNPKTTPPEPFLVPTGLILGSIGLLYLVVSLGVCSDNQFVTLTRRELASYCFSPIGYLVFGGMALCQWFGYWQFYDQLASAGRDQIPIPEPVVRFYLFNLIPILCVILPIPALTMRLIAEEKRTGTLEVLLTSPVNEVPVVLSKFLATWAFFMFCWVPSGLFLIALRSEAGHEFDYRPLLSFYAALAACSAAFVSAGLFFSSITPNQIVAAVLSFALMLGLLVCYFVKDQLTGLGATGQAFFTKLSFIDMWRESLRGQLPLRDVLVWLSAAVFGLFLSVKVLEARKWN
jgi:ABC-type transport system involved in multi-copper enzyme maturation permease subunit